MTIDTPTCAELGLSPGSLSVLERRRYRREPASRKKLEELAAHRKAVFLAEAWKHERAHKGPSGNAKAGRHRGTAPPEIGQIPPPLTSTVNGSAVSHQTCEYCGKGFEGSRASARFCSSKCRLRNHRYGVSTKAHGKASVRA